MKKEQPNQIVMLANGNITVIQRKVYNVILFLAQQELKKSPTKTFFTLSYFELKEKSGNKSTNNWALRKDIQELANVLITYESLDDKNDWGFFRSISEVKKNGNFVEIELPRTIREALVNNDYYTTIDMLTIKSLDGKYAVILYQMALRYEKIQIPEMTIEDFRKLTGTTDCYKNFFDVKLNVLTPAINEIKEKTDVILDYTLKKRGMKVTHIQFAIAR